MSKIAQATSNIEDFLHNSSGLCLTSNVGEEKHGTIRQWRLPLITLLFSLIIGVSCSPNAVNHKLARIAEQAVNNCKDRNALLEFSSACKKLSMYNQFENHEELEYALHQLDIKINNLAFINFNRQKSQIHCAY